eukprot:RCo044842
MIDCGTQPNFGGCAGFHGALPPRVGCGALPPAGFMGSPATAQGCCTFASPNAPPPTITRAALPDFSGMTCTAATFQQYFPSVHSSPTGLYADPSASVVPAPSAPPAPFGMAAQMPMMSNCCGAGGFGFPAGAGSFCNKPTTWVPSQQQLRCLQCGKLNVIPPGPGREFLCGSCGHYNGESQSPLEGKNNSYPGAGGGTYRKRSGLRITRRGVVNALLNAAMVGGMLALAIL